jgi:hypothetical protein
MMLILAQFGENSPRTTDRNGNMAIWLIGKTVDSKESADKEGNWAI